MPAGSKMPHATYSSHSRGANARLERVKVRLLGFLIVVCGGSVLLAWIAHTTWEQLDRLQKEHAAVSSESFYLGVTLRGNIRALNEKLVAFGSTANPSTREEFLREAAEVQQELETNRFRLAELSKLPLLKQILIDDFDILDRIQEQYKGYLAETATLLNTNSNSLTFQQRYNRVHKACNDLLLSCNAMVGAQRDDFTDFLAETQANLLNHERLLKLTLALIVSLAGTLAVLVYRGMIAPLRVGLSESKSIIQRQEKLASLGILASGVAHEIRNPLTAIKFRLFSLRKALPSLGENDDARIIGDEINRLERIVRDFLQFARPSEPMLARLSGEQLLQEVRELLNSQSQDSGTELVLEEGEPVWIEADGQQLKQVLINLVRNSQEAINGTRGKITLSVRREELKLRGRVFPVSVLAVKDTGKGIPPEVQARLFDPFFTTKEGGTGLGLAIAARIIEKHEGILRYETEPGKGTTFEVVLPERTPRDLSA